MGAAERRNAILKALCRRRYETISNLATEFDVSERTIRRDIEILSFTEPIYTQSGRNGGVYVVDGYRMDRMYMSEEEAGLLCKIRDTAATKSTGLLLPGEFEILERMIHTYTKPKNK